MRTFPVALWLALASFSCSTPQTAQREAPASGYDKWEFYGGSQEQTRYSRLSQITPENVSQLQVAWTYDTGDAHRGTEMQSTPIVVGGTLYSISPALRFFALDAATGEEIWSFRPPSDHTLNGHRARGVMYWTDGHIARIYAAVENRFYSLDAETGQPDPNFGDGGFIDLREGLGPAVGSVTASINTPGVVYGDLLILGSIVSERLPAAPGDVRAFDARTGELRWTFHTMPLEGEPGADTWPPNAREFLGGANSWAGLALDKSRGLVYVPTGSAAFDFYGGNRPGDNLYANSLLCLNANTGEHVWHFQFVKHDVWDRDLPAPPSLVTVERDGRLIDAVAQATKSGFVFVFNRETGEPLFPLEEVDAPASDVPGEHLAAKQVLPLKPPPFARQQFGEDELTQRTPEAHAWALEAYRSHRNGPQFTPPSLEGTFLFPGYDGGAEWGGQAFDPETGLYYVNANEMVYLIGLEKVDANAGTSASALYRNSCASCHGNDRKGTAGFPSLANFTAADRDHVVSTIRQGSERMPPFARLGDAAISALADWVVAGKDANLQLPAGASPSDLPYRHSGYTHFLDPDGYPAFTPPWGTLNAVNLDTGEIAWRIPFGEYPDLVAQGMSNTGSENYGGPIVTQKGLLFIGATIHDRKVHAFDKRTGKLLWEASLPTPNTATPALYEVGGREFLVFSAGGGKGGEAPGGSLVAFALPE